MKSEKLFISLFAGTIFASLPVNALYAQQPAAPPSPTALDRSLEQQRNASPSPSEEMRQGGDYTRSPARPDRKSHFRKQENDHKPNSNRHRSRQSWQTEAPWHSHRR